MRYNIMHRLWLLPLGLLIFCSCTNTGTLLPNITGSAYELLVVIDQKEWKAPGGHAIFKMLDCSVPMLPQSEPMFKISRVSHSEFDQMLHPARNILMVLVDSMRYTRTAVHYYNSRWAKEQALGIITTPCTDSLAAFVPRYAKQITEYFVNAERKRQIAYYKANRNGKIRNMIRQQFGIDVVVPISLNKYKQDTNFLWISNGSYDVRQDLVIYSVPYVDTAQWNYTRLVACRDSVMKANLPGSISGSYMGTEHVVLPPERTVINRNGSYCVEMRGLWKMINGDIMGGPYVSHTRLDEVHNRLVTVEGFVFAPGHEKRNYMRQLESVVYSVQMPQEVNAVVVMQKRKDTTARR